MSRFKLRAAGLAWAAAATLAVAPAAALDFAEPGFADAPFASGLSSPTAMEFSPDGFLFVAQQGGSLRVISPAGALQSAPFVSVSVISSDERGLLGVALDPAYAVNGHVFIYYTSASTGLNTISRFTRSSTSPLTANPTSQLKILEVAAADGYHNGGAIHFGADGMLYVGVGEAHTSANAQSLGNLQGKLLRIDPASHPAIVPGDNPFVGTPGARGEIWALGLRNPFSFAVDPEAGTIHINDVGQSSWEEIDRGAAGANYGWPTCEGACSNPGFVPPIHAYGHGSGCAITGGAFYRGAGFPQSMQGSYFFADYCSDWIRRLDAADGLHGFATGSSGVVDLKVGPDHALYYLTRATGAVRRIGYTASGAPLPPATLVVE